MLASRSLGRSLTLANVWGTLRAMTERRVAVLGTRYADLSVEEEVLGPLGVSLVAGDGGSAEELLATARGAEVVLAGSRPRFPAQVVEALAAEGSFVAVNNVVSQSVPHLHVHVVPRRRKDGLRGFFWPRTPYRDDAHAEEVCAALRAAVARTGAG